MCLGRERNPLDDHDAEILLSSTSVGGERFVAAKPATADALFSKSGRERQKSAQTDAPEG
jgi:hypothetical protein